MKPTLVAAGCCDHPGQTLHRLQHLFRPDPQSKKSRGESSPAPHDKTSVSTGEGIVCRQCLHGITSTAERQAINGAHAHTFANPEGIVFEIACYRHAWGCVYVGPHSPQFTWFAGTVWRIAVCANCQVHLGWRFSAADGSFFHGLITDRLIVREG
ncbi:cereblon family protein [Desulfosarcina sp.]|uniref:cereblon family protein n=1 Tax=Desulfosarcina sp. TaxID=2027861 RepID=UPI003565E686